MNIWLLALNAKKSAVTYHDTENAYLQWFKIARGRNLPVSGPLLQAKAENFAFSDRRDTV